MTRIDWVLAKKLYLSNRLMSIKQVAEQLQASPITLRIRAGKEGWFQEKQEIYRQVDAHIQATQSKQILDNLINEYDIDALGH